MLRRYAQHVITDPAAPGLDPATYSRFKFGDGVATRSLGSSLARTFFKDVVPRIPAGKPILVCPSPYEYLPPASHHLNVFFVRALNRLLVDAGGSPVLETRIYRTVSYRDDYSLMDADSRMNLIQGDTFYMDASYARGKFLIFIDDVSITGTHQRVLERMMAEQGIAEDRLFLYLAALENPEIHPQYEYYLNHSSVRSLEDLEALVCSATFLLNTRTVKFLLERPWSELRRFLLEVAPPNLKDDIYDGAVGNRYHTMDHYAENLRNLRSIL